MVQQALFFFQKLTELSPRLMIFLPGKNSALFPQRTHAGPKKRDVTDMDFYEQQSPKNRR